MTFKDMDDISKENQEREREELKKNITKDVSEVVGNLSKKYTEESKKRKEKRKWWLKLIIALLILGCFLLTINLILGNVWLLKFFIKELF
jgi:hypothetical protein